MRVVVVVVFFTVGMCSTARIVTHPSQEKKFPVGTDLTLRCQCRSSGTGMATTWMNNGITVTPEDGRIFLDRSKLIIYNTSFADSGNYTCNVTVDKLGTAKSQKLDIWGTCVQEKLLNQLLNKWCFDWEVTLNLIILIGSCPDRFRKKKSWQKEFNS